jgi:hypothetical protein
MSGGKVAVIDFSLRIYCDSTALAAEVSGNDASISSRELILVSDDQKPYSSASGTSAKAAILACP